MTAVLQLDLLDLLEPAPTVCWRCRHNIGRRSDGRYCWCDLPIPYPPGERRHDGSSAYCWCDGVPDAEIEASEAWVDNWLACNASQ